MVFGRASIHSILERSKGKSLICFGAGRLLAKACKEYSGESFFERIAFIADNDPGKTAFAFKGVEKPVHSIARCLEIADREPIVLITVADCLDIAAQLEGIPALRRCEGYFYVLAREEIVPYSLLAGRAQREPLKIPKTIHYCWFGGAKIRGDLAEYMKSWKKYCPGYDIVRWDESNYDYKKNEYMYEAYKHKKWSFVSDYARLDIINAHGGVYLDTDVELIKNIDDFLCDEAFWGFEDISHLNNGQGYGAVRGFPLLKEHLESYEELAFVNADSSLNMTPCPYYQSEFFSSKGVLLNNSLQKLNGMAIYPSDVFAPLDYHTGVLAITENTHAIHHYEASWQAEEHRAYRGAVWQKGAAFSQYINR